METLLIETDAIAWSEEKFSSLLEGNKDAFSTLFDERGLLFYSDGTVKTKAELLAGLNSATLRLKGFDLGKCISRTYGSTVVIHGEGMFSLENGGEAEVQKLSFVDVWVNRELGWKLVSSHFIKMG